MKVVVIGGGASGFFSAINIAEKHPEYEVIILEKSSKLLSKVKVSGGGRCNVTNARNNPSELVQFYPRGGKKLYNLFKSFSTTDMVSWLAKKGVPTHAEDDQRVFPISNSSQTIIDCFVNTAYDLNIKIQQNCTVKTIFPRQNYWVILTSTGEIEADKIVYATGSSPQSLKVLTELGLKQTPLAPSLFTFNIDDPRIEGLPGISFQNVNIRITKSKLQESGPLLITHWGLSGPAILKLSSWGALELQQQQYKFAILLDFLPSLSSEEVRNELQQLRNHPKKLVLSNPQFELTKRFWERLCAISNISTDQQCGELTKKQINKLTEELKQGLYTVSGKSTFKDEFVTCGGIDLDEISLDTFECKRYPGLYLAGEVLDIDALTGGFNFQACWSAGWLISSAIGR